MVDRLRDILQEIRYGCMDVIQSDSTPIKTGQQKKKKTKKRKGEKKLVWDGVDDTCIKSKN